MVLRDAERAGLAGRPLAAAVAAANDTSSPAFILARLAEIDPAGEWPGR